MAGGRIGLREDDVDARDAGVRDEALRAVEHVGVAVAPRLGEHRRRIRAGAGLGERVGRQPLARGELRQEAPLLLLAAGELERERAELLHRQDQPARRADLRDLLDRDEGRERARADPAVLLVGERREDRVLAEELDDVPRELRRLVDLGRPRRDPLAGKAPDELADLSLLGRQRVVRHRESLDAGSRSAASARRGQVLPRKWNARGTKLQPASRAGNSEYPCNSEVSPRHENRGQVLETKLVTADLRLMPPRDVCRRGARSIPTGPRAGGWRSRRPRRTSAGRS